MRMIAVLFLVLSTIPEVAMGVGLGKMQVLSGLNQPFEATIPITGVTAKDLESISAALADTERFRNAGIERKGYLLTLRFEVTGTDSVKPFVRVSSPQPLKEPFLNFLVEVNTASSRLVQQFTALFDPPKPQ